MLHRERRQLQGEEEEEEERAHSGCQPVSLRLHETLMDLIDWWEHQGVWAELSADRAPVLGGKINLADTSRVRSAPHRASIQQLRLIEEQSKVWLCLRINMPCVVAVIVRNVSDHGGGGLLYNMASELISCQSINKVIWRDIHFWTLIDMENVLLFQMCLRKDLKHRIKIAQWSVNTRHFIYALHRQEHQTRNCSFIPNIHIRCNKSNMYGYI